MRGYPLRKLGPLDGTGEWKFSQTLNNTEMEKEGRRVEEGERVRMGGARKGERDREKNGRKSGRQGGRKDGRV